MARDRRDFQRVGFSIHNLHIKLVCCKCDTNVVMVTEINPTHNDEIGRASCRERV